MAGIDKVLGREAIGKVAADHMRPGIQSPKGTPQSAAFPAWSRSRGSTSFVKEELQERKLRVIELAVARKRFRFRPALRKGGWPRVPDLRVGTSRRAAGCCTLVDCAAG